MPARKNSGSRQLAIWLMCGSIKKKQEKINYFDAKTTIMKLKIDVFNKLPQIRNHLFSSSCMYL